MPALGTHTALIVLLLLLPVGCSSGRRTSPPAPPVLETGERPPSRPPAVPDEVARARSAEESLERFDAVALPPRSLEELVGTAGPHGPASGLIRGTPSSRSPTPAERIVSPRIADRDAAALAIDFVIEGLCFAPGSANPDRPTEAALAQLASRLRLGDRDFLIEIQAAAAGAPDLAARRGRAVALMLSRDAGLARERLAVVVLGARVDTPPKPPPGDVAILVLRPASSP